MTRPIESISVIGLGKLGAPIAACLAERGFRVISADLAEAKVEALNRGAPPVQEPDLPALLERARPRLSATTDLAQAVRDTDATFIIVPTPSDSDGEFSLRFVESAAQRIGEALGEKSTYHLVTLTSTVMPGATGGDVRRVLEMASGKRCGHDFGLCYSPEFVALGTVIRDFLHPDFLLIGEWDRRSGDALEAIYRRVCEPMPAVSRLTLVNSELAKLAVNAFITTKISYANMLADLCHHVPGGDVEQVTAALGLDRRIGSVYLKGAVSYGGPCFPRDNRAMAALAQRVDVPAELVETVDQVNRQHHERLLELVRGYLPANGTVGVLGLAYKPGSDVIEHAAGVLLARDLLQQGVPVIAHDPVAMENTQRALGDELMLANTVTNCVRNADVVVLTTPWSAYDAIDASMLQRPAHRSRPVVIDCWRRLDAEQIAPAAQYVAFGSGEAAGPAAATEATQATRAHASLIANKR